MEAAYRYSATKSNGKFYGGVYFGNEQIGLIDGIKSARGCKAFAKSASEQHSRDNKAPEYHGESHSIHGSLSL